MVENGTGPSNSAERSVNGTWRDEDMAEAGNKNENEDNENNENDEEEEEDDDDDDHEGPYTPFDLPGKKLLLCLRGVCLDMLESIADACRGRSVSESFHQLSFCSEAPGHV